LFGLRSAVPRNLCVNSVLLAIPSKPGKSSRGPGPDWGLSSGHSDSAENRLNGHTSWQTSHPKTHSPSPSLNSRGIAPLFSMVRYDRHRRESSLYAPANAPVGQAVMHLVQLPQLTCVAGSSGSSATFTNISARKNHEPRLGCSKLVFLPKNPNPALTAAARS